MMQKREGRKERETAPHLGADLLGNLRDQQFRAGQDGGAGDE